MDNNKNFYETRVNGKGFKLVPISKEYIEILYKWECDLNSKYLWTMDAEIVPKEEYENRLYTKLKSQYNIFFLILNFEETPIGFIYSQDMNCFDGHTYVTAYISEGNRNLGVGAKAGLLFFNYLFSYYPIRKIYCDVFEYNESSLSSLKHAGFKVEGTFNEHRFYQGKYYTMFRLALYRGDFYNKYEGIINKVMNN